MKIADEAEGITGIGAEPDFAIRQRALLLQSPAGNVMWDCQAVVTDAGVAEIARRGGLTAIAISHPHYYSSMVEWSEAFGGVPIYLHADDRQWVMRPSPHIVHWEGETLEINDAMTLIRCGGHFPGGQVLHWGAALGGKGALMSGDIVMVATDRSWVTFMHSFPNYIPLNRARGRSDRGEARALRVRLDLRRLVGPCPPRRREGGAQPFGRALSQGDRRLRNGGRVATAAANFEIVPVTAPGRSGSPTSCRQPLRR